MKSIKQQKLFGQVFSFILMMVLFIFSSSKLQARPQEIEIWFLSPYYDEKQSFNFFFYFAPQFSFPVRAASASMGQEQLHAQCKLMGEYFFHPQFGLHQHSFSSPTSPSSPMKEEKENLVTENNNNKESIEIKNNWEENVVQCNKGYYFDLYCGEGSAAKTKPVTMEIWLDVSASFIHVDPTQKNQECFRKSFLKKLKNHCGKSQKIELKTFNTSLKSINSENYVCLEHGLNDAKRLMEWIEAAKVKKLLIITDIFEYSLELSDYLDSVGAKVVGEAPGQSLMAKNLTDKVESLSPFCK